MRGASRHVVAVALGLVVVGQFVPRSGLAQEGGGLPPNLALSSGTGVVISAQGHVLTNHHVVAGCGYIAVSLDDDFFLPFTEARLLFADEAMLGLPKSGHFQLFATARPLPLSAFRSPARCRRAAK
jgi:hypothetical protein